MHFDLNDSGLEAIIAFIFQSEMGVIGDDTEPPSSTMALASTSYLATDPA